MTDSKLKIHDTTIDEDNMVNITLVDPLNYEEYSSSSERLNIRVHIPEDAKFIGNTLGGFQAMALLKARQMLDEVILKLPAQTPELEELADRYVEELAATDFYGRFEEVARLLGITSLTNPHDKLKDKDKEEELVNSALPNLFRRRETEETKYWMIIGEEYKYEDPDKVSSYRVVSNKYIAFTAYSIEKFKQNYPMHNIAFTLNIIKEIYEFFPDRLIRDFV